MELHAGNFMLALSELRELDRRTVLEKARSQRFLHYTFKTSRKCFPAVIKELNNKGVTIDSRPVVLGNGMFIFFKDPDGNRLK